jgi:hypothetical protein
MNMQSAKWLVGLLLMGALSASSADQAVPDKDVTYFAIVKNHVFAQDANGKVTETGYSFLGYIFVKPDSRVSDAFLTFPGEQGRTEAFPDYRQLNTAEKDTYLFINSPAINADKAQYDSQYPDGVYTVKFTTSSGEHRAALKIEGGVYPAPAVISIAQAGKGVASESIDAQQDLRVTWGGFPQGRPDPRGILDDVVFVIVKDCHGAKVLHSGRPYQGFHLLYSDKDYVIPANTMKPGRNYELIVDNGLVVDSNTDAGVPGVGFYAQTNKLKVKTTGKAEQGADCAIE